MSSSTSSSTSPDGTVTTVVTDDGTPPVPPMPPLRSDGSSVMLVAGDTPAHRGHPMPGEVLFMFGMIAGALLLWLIQRGNRAKVRRAVETPTVDRFGTDVEALARRTATLERIVTDPARRVDAEIDALR